MFQFSKDFFKVGGKVLIPDSFVSKTDFAEIVEINNVGLHVMYHKGKTNAQKVFFSFAYLQQQYGKKQLLLPPPNGTTLCKKCQKFTKFCICEELDDDLSDIR